MIPPVTLSTTTLRELFASRPPRTKRAYYVDTDRFVYALGNLVLAEFASVRLIGEIEYPEGKKTYEVLRRFLEKTLLC